MLSFLLRRLLVAIPTLFVVVTVAFFMMRAAPGSPFSGDRKLPPEIEKNIEAKYGMDKPLLVQYVDYVGGVLHGDFGPSLKYRDKSVLDIIAQSGVDLDSLVLHSRDEWESHANWKTMLENFLECYHCAIAHPGFSAAIDVMPDNYNLAVHGWFSSQVGMVRQSALEGRSQVKIYNARGEVAQAQYHLLFPNMTVNVNPGFPNLSIDVWWPNGPNGTGQPWALTLKVPPTLKSWLDFVTAGEKPIGSSTRITSRQRAPALTR